VNSMVICLWTRGWVLVNSMVICLWKIDGFLRTRLCDVANTDDVGSWEVGDSLLVYVTW
jgi:hypothetical protein